ncbi:Hypothetical protein D9617_36g063330 [Elsinoe fawcettii]|nr:Hypothetical protein D9617_36g063330 [Elsinoe fawcettii]
MPKPTKQEPAAARKDDSDTSDSELELDHIPTRDTPGIFDPPASTPKEKWEEHVNNALSVKPLPQLNAKWSATRAKVMQEWEARLGEPVTAASTEDIDDGDLSDGECVAVWDDEDYDVDLDEESSEEEDEEESAGEESAGEDDDDTSIGSEDSETDEE